MIAECNRCLQRDTHIELLKADNARLTEAICEFVEAFDRDPIKYADLMDRTREAVDGLYEIALEGE